MRYALFAATMVATFSGCKSGLAVKQISIDPPEPKIGSTATMYVTFKGPADRVASVIAVLQENPDVQYVLNNKGVSGDEVANDRTWTHQEDVPYDASPGTYHLKFVVRDADGSEIPTDGLLAVEVRN